MNRILTDKTHGKRIAVIENEFAAELGVETELVASKTSAVEIAEAVEVSNGCLCCSGNSDFQRKLEVLLETRRDKFDYIVIETTELASTEFSKMFFTDNRLSQHVYLDGIITLVDATCRRKTFVRK